MLSFCEVPHYWPTSNFIPEASVKPVSHSRNAFHNAGLCQCVQYCSRSIQPLYTLSVVSLCATSSISLTVEIAASTHTVMSPRKHAISSTSPNMGCDSPHFGQLKSFGSPITILRASLPKRLYIFIFQFQ